MGFVGRFVRQPGLVAALGFVLSFAVAGATPAKAQPTWDQAKVSAIAAQLPAAGDAWEQTTRRQNDTIGSGTSQEVDDITRKARTIHEMCNGLAAHIKKGDGLEQTRDMFFGIKELQDDTNVLAPRANLNDDSLAAWNTLNGLLNELATYYGPPPKTKL